MQYAAVALGWILWCTLHSVMIAAGTTARLRIRLGNRYRFYRLFYTATATLTLVPALALTRSARGSEVFTWSGPLKGVQVLFGVAALSLLLAGARHYDLWRLLGIRQILESESSGGLAGEGGFQRTGVLSLVRHPWYAGGILALWARDIDGAAMTMNAVLTAYLVIGAFLEERKLMAEFGERYAAYRREVSMFIPLRWLRARLCPGGERGAS